MMGESQGDSLLAQLAGHGTSEGSPDPWALVAARQPQHQTQPAAQDPKLDAMLERLRQMAGQPAEAPAAAAATEPAAVTQDQPAANAQPADAEPEFMPVEPESFRKAELTDSEVEALALKYLLARGDATGRAIAEQVRLPFVLLDELLRGMKNDQLLVHRGAAPMNDFQYQLTDLGRERARRYAAHCTYFGAAPVSLKDYLTSVAAQSLTKQRPSADNLRLAFDDLLLGQRMLDRLGPAINSGRGLFLYGAPGNGKTSIAQRVTRAFGQTIWIPRAISIDGEIVRLFDPANHEEMPLEACQGVFDQRKIDRRWVRIRRPTIIAGGELTMASLEVTVNTSTGISEAPLQLKSNCGTLVIDDFGRQRMSIDELLNRWILPLEMRFDLLCLSNGKKIQVPFDQFIIFSTNLEPRDLVDEAFLRRIPYKIEVKDPDEQEFRDLLAGTATKLGFAWKPEAVDYLIDRHYRAKNRPFRFCHPRDLLLQVRSYCAYKDCPLELTEEFLDMAVENYFGIM